MRIGEQRHILHWRTAIAVHTHHQMPAAVVTVAAVAACVLI
jgi:hypothetical protein